MKSFPVDILLTDIEMPEENGLALFPDAPTERGLKHVRGLTALSRQGNRCVVLIVIQMKGVHTFEPNWATYPAFGEALIEARQAGVEIIAAANKRAAVLMMRVSISQRYGFFAYICSTAA